MLHDQTVSIDRVISQIETAPILDFQTHFLKIYETRNIKWLKELLMDRSNYTAFLIVTPMDV